MASWLLSAAIASSTAQAQNGILAPGDAVLSGFSGIRQQPTSATGGNPLDRFFIDLDGPSAQILPLKSLGGAPVGQLAAASPTLTIKASDVGQVFAVALDDGLGQPTPNIYLGASSVFGIHIVKADPATGAFRRIRRGEPGAQFMPGQFGPGSPDNTGAIWRVDGATGEVSLFATVPNNSGPGIGDIVFAPHAKQFYVSDLETGRIYRLNTSGVVIDHYDHGVQGRPKKSLPPLADDGRAMSITSPRFNSLRPETWGYTQKSRRVWGMAIRERRLFYAVAGGGQIWSVGLAEDGAFADDIRWEMDAAQALKGSGPVTDLAFDKSGNLYVAQRGQQRASYRYAEFVAPGEASVVSFEPRESSDAAAAIGLLQLRDQIPVGVTSHESAGGLALGYGYTEDGTPRLDACDSTVWVTGDRLRSSRDATAAGAGPAADVHGLQGLDVSAAVDSGQALSSAYFLDYDGFFGDPGKAGHIGDVAIWQPCDGAVISSAGPSELPPGYLPPGEPPIDLPPEFPPPPQPYSANLALTKRALPSSCLAFAAGWACKFEMQVRNTGKDTYAGPVLISEDLTAAPAGASVGFAPLSQWQCWNDGPSRYKCLRPDTVLAAGASVSLTSLVWVPNTYLQCYVQNIAAIEWAPPGTQWNSDPTDDISTATALVPSPNCPPPTGPTNLTITKTADPAGCFLLGGDVVCQFALTVTNSGPNLYSDAIQVYDEPMPGTIAEFGPAPWSCAASGAGFDCSHPATLLFPNQQLHLWSWVRMPVDAAQFEGCQITNEAWITSAPGGTQPNLDPADDSASATAFAPGNICVAAANQEKVECPAGFAVKDGACQPVVQPLPIVTPPPKIVCPRNMEKVRRSEVSRLRSEGWKLIRLKGGQWCGRPGVRPPPVDPCPHTMDRVPASQVAQLRREGWDVSRVQGTNIWCGRPGRPVDPCYDGERLITSKRQADNLRGRGATVRRVRWNGQRAWCTGPVPPPIIIDPPICIGGNLSKAGRGWICICPRGYLRDRRVTNAGRLRFRCTPGPDPRRCNRNEQTVTSLVQVQLLKAKRYRVRKIGTRLWCARPPIQSNQCRHGERTVRSAIVLATLRPRARTIRKIGKKHWCVTLWPRCKIGHVRKNGKCVPIIKKCPKGMVGVWPKCIPKKCPRGTTGKFPLCKPIIKKCPKGTIGIWPRCIKKKCPPGTKGKFPLCKPIIKKCPKGTIGIYPRCIKKKCPPGTKGKFPLCKPIIKCPKGTVGKFPKCRKIGGKPKPPKCPVGYKGRPPNCKPLVKLPKFKCPKGTVGKWPKCKRVD